MQYVERAAPKHLAPFIECVWEVRGRGSGSADRIVPDGCPEIIVHLGDVFSRRISTLSPRRVSGSGTAQRQRVSSTSPARRRHALTAHVALDDDTAAHWKKQPRIFLAGTLTRPWILRSGKDVRTVGIRFRPGGFTTLFGGSLAGTADREVALTSFLAPSAERELRTTLRRAPTTLARINAVDQWLTPYAKREPSRSTAQTALDIILKTRGQLRVDEIATRANMTRRSLERVFRRDLGVGPKIYARIVRLNAVLARLDETERQTAVDLALHAGYFDQAHLLRDFRDLVGRLPRKSRAEDGEMARHFTRPARLRSLFLGE